MTINFGASYCACTKMSMKKSSTFRSSRAIFLERPFLTGSSARNSKRLRRALAGQCIATISYASPLLTLRISLTDGRGQEWIPPQQIVILEVFVTERQSINALPYQVFNRMLNQLRIAMVGEAGGKLSDDLPLRLDLFEEEHPAIGCDRPSLELGHHLPCSAGLKLEFFISTRNIKGRSAEVRSGKQVYPRINSKGASNESSQGGGPGCPQSNYRDCGLECAWSGRAPNADQDKS